MFESFGVKIVRFLLPLIFLLTASVTWAEPARPLSEMLPEFEKAVQTLHEQSGVPGLAVGIVYRGKVVYLKGFGVRKAGTSMAVDSDTVFQVASCSKPITSTALASLVGKGVIKFDQPVSSKLPEFKLQDSWTTSQVAFADLLSHRSGLPALAGDHLENLGLERDDILGRLQYLKPGYPFRAGYAYTNFGFTAAGEAAARASHTDFPTLLEQELFQPLGMNSTSARLADYENATNRAFTHQLDNGKAVVTHREPDAQAPAGGVSSTVRDLSHWMLLHLKKGEWQDRQLIPSEALGQTYQIHSVTSNNPANFSSKGFYGLGWGIAYDDHGHLKLSHSGAFNLGVRSSVTLIPQEEWGVVVLSNASPSALPESISAVFEKMYNTGTVDLAFGHMVQEKVTESLTAMNAVPASEKSPAPGQPALALESYTGHYPTDYYGDSQVVLKSGSLVFNIGKKQFPLTHLYRDTFIAKVQPHTFEDLVNFQLQFCLNTEGKVIGFHQSGLQGPGWFGKGE
jgi:CubicO group peptidase (beta-lactamase class C family)